MADLSAFFGEDEEEDYYLYEGEESEDVEENLTDLNISNGEEEKDCPIEAEADINEELTLAINTPIPNNNTGINGELKIITDLYSNEQEEELNHTPLIFLGKYAEDMEFESIDDTGSIEYLIKSVHAQTMARKLWAAENMTSILNRNPWLEGFKNVFPLANFILGNSHYEFKTCLAEKFDELLIFVYKYIDVKNDYLPRDFTGIDFDKEINLILSNSILVGAHSMLGANEACFLKLNNFLSKSSPESILHFFHTIIKRMKEVEEDSTNYRPLILTDSMKALSIIARFLSIETINDDLVPVLSRMSSYQQYETRKESIICISYLIESRFTEIDHDLMIRLYDNLVADNNHEVRQEACLNFKHIADTLVAQNRKDDLIKWIDMLFDDTSSKVKTCAQGAIGPVIYAFRNSQVPSSLMEKYIEMPNSPKPDVRLNCAKNFPGVLLTLGPNGWNELKDIFNQLTHDSFSEVQYVIASFLHELPNIISPESMATDVIPVINEFLGSHHDHFGFIIASNVSNLLSKLEPSAQESISSSIYQFLTGKATKADTDSNGEDCYSMKYTRINTLILEYIKSLIPFMNLNLIKNTSEYCITNLRIPHPNVCKLNMIKLYGPITARLLELDSDANELSKFLEKEMFAKIKQITTDYRFRQFSIMIGYEIIQASCSNPDIHCSIISNLTNFCQFKDKSTQLSLIKFLKQITDLDNSDKFSSIEEFVELYKQLKSTEDPDILYELSKIVPAPF